MFLIFPGGNVIVRSARVLGTMNPPPMPVKARMTQSAMKLSENPDAIEHMVHHVDATTIIFLCPKIMPRRPPMRTNAPWVKL
jgi:hypothetical protein